FDEDWGNLVNYPVFLEGGKYMINSVRMQFSLMINKLGFKLSFSCALIYSLASYVYYLITYQGVDVLYFLSANYLYAGNEHAPFWGIFQSYFPFLVVFPFAFSYLDDKDLNIDHYIIGRMSRKDYYIGKLITSFLGGGLIIFIPFTINLILCNITFQENNNTYFGEYNLLPYFETLSGTNVIFNTEFTGVSFLGLYLFSPLLYNIVYLLLLSLFSGIMSVFTCASSFFIKKYKIILL